MDLGRFYDLTAAKAAAEEVKAHTHAYKAAYVRERADRRTAGIITRELRRRGGEGGKTTRRFLGSITHKGYIWRFDSVDALCPKVYELADSWELAGEMLARLHRAAADSGWNTIICCAPEQPDRIEHLQSRRARPACDSRPGWRPCCGRRARRP